MSVGFGPVSVELDPDSATIGRFRPDLARASAHIGTRIYRVRDRGRNPCGTNTEGDADTETDANADENPAADAIANSCARRH